MQMENHNVQQRRELRQIVEVLPSHLLKGFPKVNIALWSATLFFLDFSPQSFCLLYRDISSLFTALPLALPLSAHTPTPAAPRNASVPEPSQQQRLAAPFFQGSALTLYYSCRFCCHIMSHSHAFLLVLYHSYISQSFTGLPPLSLDLFIFDYKP